MPILPEELEKAKCFGISSSDILAAKRNKNDYCAYVELHIEQGGILENEAKDIGIVEGMVLQDFMLRSLVMQTMQAPLLWFSETTLCRSLQLH